MALKFYTSVAKGLKLEAKKFWELICTLLEITGEKQVEKGGGGFLPLLFINKVNKLKFQPGLKVSI